MKNTRFNLFLVLIVVGATLFCSCSGGIGGEEAREHIVGFLEAIEEEDYESAKTFLHPERPIDIQIYFEGIMTDEAVDFSKGITIVRFKNFSSAYYDSSVKGSAYSVEMDVTVGGEEMEMEIELVKNEAGFGIYDLDIDA